VNSLLDRGHRAQAVEHRAKGQRRQDHPHEHARDEQRIAGGDLEHPRVKRRLMTAAATVAADADQLDSTRLVQPFTKGSIIAKKMMKGSAPAFSDDSFSPR
jgi:hypothetical protein